MLPGFLKGLGRKFAINTSEFPSDDVKISYAGALLKRSVRDWFHPQIKKDGSNNFANYAAFVTALKSAFGDSNTKATA